MTRALILLVLAAGIVSSSFGASKAEKKDKSRSVARGQMTNVVDRINSLPPVSVQTMFDAVGVDETGQVAITQSNWDEDVVVDTIIRCNAYRLLTYITVPEMAKLTSANLAKLKGPIIAARFPELVQWGLAYPENEREDFRPAILQLMLSNTPNWPVYAAKQTKYWGTGKDMLVMGDAQDILELILAPEWSLTSAQITIARERLKNIAVLAARKKLRAEGKSFVAYSVVSTNNGVVSTNLVNPLVSVVQTVVDAINAPAYSGIEAALGGLGVTVTNVDRSGATTLANDLKTQILAGELTGTENPAYLPKLSVILGVVEYNKFVDDYNKGK